MSAPDRPAPEVRPFELRIRVGDRTLSARGGLPDIPIRVADFLPVLQSLSSSIAEFAEERENRAGRRISCRAGCGACCRQPVPIAPSEAIRLAELVQEMPAERRERIQKRFAEGMRRLSENGLVEELENLEIEMDSDRRQALGLRYFRLGIPCPFLEEEQCSIHPDRPLACREYSVTSPARHCADPSAESVRMVRQPIRLSQLVFRFEDGRGDAPPRTLLLIQALTRARAEQNNAQPVFAPETLFRNLIGKLRQTEAPGTD